MNQADKAEALRWIAEIMSGGGNAKEKPPIDKLKALIERQPDDTDGEMWRFCVEHGFPWHEGGCFAARGSWGMAINEPSKHQVLTLLRDTPTEAVQAAMAAMKE